MAAGGERWPGILGEVMRARGKRERGKGAATEHPHHPVELVEYSFVGREQRGDRAASSRGAAMAAPERALGAKVLRVEVATMDWGKLGLGLAP
jgi:hypothetical protein